jgi:glycosyltransferase involved in cell wall biosynthesis
VPKRGSARTRHSSPFTSSFATSAVAICVNVPAVDLITSVGRDELPGLLAEHYLFVLVSWFEGMPMPLSMLEAAAARLACIVSAVRGNLDVFRIDDPQPDGALLVAPGDVDELSDALAASEVARRWGAESAGRTLA